MSRKTREPFEWLDRRIAAPGPYLTLVLSQEEFDIALTHLKIPLGAPYVKNTHSHATAHMANNPKGELCCIVALAGWQDRDPIEVAGLLVHEAVHVWQDYAERIGEHTPGVEQEAYAIQSIAQELMAEFARRMGAR